MVSLVLNSLNPSLLRRNSGVGKTHLIQNTHLQLAYSVRIPPNIGPKTPATAKTNPTSPAMNFFCSLEDTSGKMIMAMLYSPVFPTSVHHSLTHTPKRHEQKTNSPDPPTPCSARKAISWLIFRLNPQASENAIKMPYADRKAALRPITSDMRAKRTAQLRKASEYARATQLMTSRSWNSAAMVMRLVETIDESSIARKRPRPRLLFRLDDDDGGFVGYGEWGR